MAWTALGNLELDRDLFAVRIGGRPVELSYIQFELLCLLVTNAGRVVDHERLVRAIWGETPADGARKLRIHVSRLRKRIAGSRPWRIKTVTKRGYALVDSEAGARLPAFVLAHAPVRPAGGEGVPR